MRFVYQEWKEDDDGDKPAFDRLFDLFQQLLTIAGGDVAQALRWLTDLDQTYQLTEGQEYSIGDFVQELKDRGFLKEEESNHIMIMTPKMERSIRQRALEDIFSSLKKGSVGQHKTSNLGSGTEQEPETRAWNYGDDLSQIDGVGTIMNTLKHSSLERFEMEEKDLQVYETDHHTTSATALLIDMSHSMILYGEDRITPAKKVAMALSELIMTRYPKDSLDIIAFGDKAWPVEVKDLPYLKVGPYHTNTLHALELARDTLNRRRNVNKQIFLITDGKPSCMIDNGRFYKNSFGLDRKIVNKVLDESVKCRRDRISITTFMIASDPYLQGFVRELTEANHGRAYYASLNELGGFIFEDYIRNRRKHVR